MKLEIIVEESNSEKLERLLKDITDEPATHHVNCHGFVDCLGKGEFLQAWDYFVDLF